MSDEPLADYEEKILKNVTDFGCHVTFVFDPDGKSPDFAYSVGFTKTVNQPEIICFGLSKEVMHDMINETHDQCCAGLELVDGVKISGLLEGFDVVGKILPAHRIEYNYLNSAMWYHDHQFQTELTRVMQLVWPSSIDGLFPWDAGCADDVIELQPALYQPALNS